MRSLIYTILAVSIMTMTASSCIQKKERSLRGDARELYVKSRRITEAYLDSMASAKDSASLLSLCTGFDDAITKLNYEYSAGADYEISEGENDTLATLTTRFISIRDSLLHAYANSTKEPAVPMDSTEISSGLDNPHLTQ